MTGRGKLIALQTGIVTILIAIAYVLFLRGEDPGELFGIDAPGDSQLESDARGNGNGGGSGDGNRARGANGSGGGPGGSRPAVGSPASTPAAGQALASAPTPSDNQYGDTLSLLKAELGVTARDRDERSRRGGIGASRSP